MCVKNFHFKRFYFRQPLSENPVFRTTYIHKQTVKTMISYGTSHYMARHSGQKPIENSGVC